MALPFLTIGHSTRQLDEFFGLLTASQVELVVDVRTIPRSRTNPQYNSGSLQESLFHAKIAYQHIAELGGRRSKVRGIPPDINGLWKNQSFHNYADHALGASFQSGFARLRELGHMQRCAVMCAEAVWWRCHRRIIADYLLAAGEDVKHILGPSHIDAAVLTAGAVARADGTVIYPPEQPNLPLF